MAGRFVVVDEGTFGRRIATAGCITITPNVRTSAANDKYQLYYIDKDVYLHEK